MSTIPEPAESEGVRPITCPALILALAIAFGIALVTWLAPANASSWRALPFLIAGAAACLLVAAILLRSGPGAASPIVLLAGFVFAGGALPILFAHRFPLDHVSHLDEWGLDLNRPVQAQGSIVTEPAATPSGLEFDIVASRISQIDASRRPALQVARQVSGKVRVRLESLAEGEDVFDLHPGDVIEAAMLLRRPHSYQNPGSFDFRKRAEEIEDLYWEGSVSGAGDIRKLPAPSGMHPSRPIWRLRFRIRRAIDRLYPPWSAEGRDGAVLKAILLGERSSLDSATIDHFRVSGLYHLLVIAGLHVGLIAGLIAGLLRLLGLNRTWRNALLLAVIVAYALLVEQRAPTLRATLMIVAFIVADLLGRDHTALNSVGLAALVLLLARPAWLFESGFQLSFAAALLIVGLAGPLLRLSIEPYHRSLSQLDNVDLDTALDPRQAQFRLDLRSLVAVVRGRSAYLDRHPLAATRLIVWPLGAGLRLVEIAALSAVLQIGLLLPMVETFHRVTLVGIGLNSLALPLMAVLLAIAIPTVALATVAPSWAVLPGKVLAVVFKVLFRLAELPHLPAWLSYRVPSPPIVIALGFAAALILLALAVGRSRAGAFASAAVFGVFAVLLATEPFASNLPTSGTELTSLDCGRGQASFVSLPGGSTILIGAGGVPGTPTSALTARWDPGENIVAPYLWSRRVKNLDVLLAPGSNLDGVAAILGDFHVRELWLAPQRGRWNAAAIAAVTPGLRRGTIIRPVAAGEVLRLGDTTVQISDSGAAAINPAGNGGATVRIANEDGSALFVGGLPDMMQTAGAAVGGSGGNTREDVLVISRPDFLAVARSSPLAATRAEAALVSPGRTSREDSAARAALAQLDLRIPIFQTDLDGAVTARLKTGSIEVRTFRSRTIGKIQQR